MTQANMMNQAALTSLKNVESNIQSAITSGINQQQSTIESQRASPNMLTLDSIPTWSTPTSPQMAFFLSSAMQYEDFIIDTHQEQQQQQQQHQQHQGLGLGYKINTRVST
jgi:hypothetical protein